MTRTIPVLVAFLLAARMLAGNSQNSPAQKTSETKSTDPNYKITPEDIARKNPVSPTPEGLAHAKKLYGYDCAMCHGKEGDGKGDLAADMKLQLRDWRDPSTISGMTDGELFYIISNGKGKMIGGEGDRTPETVRWNMVTLVRSFGKKSSGDKPKDSASQ